jgi:hypothetical protein
MIFWSDFLNFDSETIYSLNEVNYLDSLEILRNRTSQCNKVNTMGRKLLEICNINNIFILNDIIGNDISIGKLTFRETSLIYFSLCSLKLLPRQASFEILEVDSLLSDGHCHFPYQLAADDPPPPLPRAKIIKKKNENSFLSNL